MKETIGQIIYDRVKLSKISITEFAKQINMDRSTVYDVFKRRSIDTELLDKIGQVLGYDFFIHFLQADTLDKLRMTHKMTKAKVVVEIELTEHEIDVLQLEERAKQKIFVLKDTGQVAESAVEYKANTGD